MPSDESQKPHSPLSALLEVFIVSAGGAGSLWTPFEYIEMELVNVFALRKRLRKRRSSAIPHLYHAKPWQHR